MVGTVSALCIDIRLIKDIDSYKDINAAVSGIAMKKFLGHHWYLSEELFALAFFDDDVPDDTRRKMVLSLQYPGAEHPLKRITLEPYKTAGRL